MRKPQVPKSGKWWAGKASRRKWRTGATGLLKSTGSHRGFSARSERIIEPAAIGRRCRDSESAEVAGLQATLGVRRGSGKQQREAGGAWCSYLPPPPSPAPASSPPFLQAWLRPARLASDVSALAGAACDVTARGGGVVGVGTHGAGRRLACRFGTMKKVASKQSPPKLFGG